LQFLQPCASATVLLLTVYFSFIIKFLSRHLVVTASHYVRDVNIFIDSSNGANSAKRERRSELLARATPELVRELAEQALGLTEVSKELTVTQPPQTGLVMMQVREPVCKERFYLGEVVTTRAEVALGETRGWSMRLGSDKQTALGAAICDVVAELGDARTDGLATQIEALCDRTEYRLSQESALEWSEIAKTIVDFEELD
jgi:phosphonate C-P lyase system protein PhnG